MWATQPHWTAADLGAIKVPTWIVDADHDEAIKRENTEFMAGAIPDAGLLCSPRSATSPCCRRRGSSPTTCCSSWRANGRDRGETIPGSPPPSAATSARSPAR